MGPWLIEVRTPKELEPWLAGGPSNRPVSAVMLVRGDEPLVRLFLPNALDAAKKDDGRAVVWLKDPSVIDSARMTEMFGNGESHLAVVLGPGGGTVAWVSRDRIEVDDAAFAFAAAGDAQESGNL